MKKILSIVLSVALLCAACALCVSATKRDEGAVRVVPLKTDAYYAAVYVWTGVKTKDTAVNFSFYAKGRLGDTISIDFEGQQKTQVDYTFTKNYEWELVSGSLEGTNDAGDQTNGYPFRIYTWQDASTEAAKVVNGYWIDNLTVGTNSCDFDQKGIDGWPIGGWPGGSYVEYDAHTDYDLGTVHTSVFDDKYVTVCKVSEGAGVPVDINSIKATGVHEGCFNNAEFVGTSHLYLNNDGKSRELGLGASDSCYLEIKFNGTECALYTHYRCMGPSAHPTNEYVTSNSVKVTVDGEVVTSNVVGVLTASGMHNTEETAVFSVTGLEDGAHVIKLENLDVEPGVILRWLHVDSIMFGTGTAVYNPATADMTAVIALIGVVACAGVVVAAKKH